MGLLVAICALIIMSGGIHKINEGHVGIYSRGGALLSGWSNPGFNLMIPGITSYHEIQFTIQTDKVTNIPCGTSSGVVIYFGNFSIIEFSNLSLDKIEVVNRLEKDLVWATVKNYTVKYDQTWIFDKIQ